MIIRISTRITKLLLRLTQTSHFIHMRNAILVDPTCKTIHECRASKFWSISWRDCWSVGWYCWNKINETCHYFGLRHIIAADRELLQSNRTFWPETTDILTQTYWPRGRTFWLLEQTFWPKTTDILTRTYWPPDILTCNRMHIKSLVWAHTNSLIHHTPIMRKLARAWILLQNTMQMGRNYVIISAYATYISTLYTTTTCINYATSVIVNEQTVPYNVRQW